MGVFSDTVSVNAPYAGPGDGSGSVVAGTSTAGHYLPFPASQRSAPFPHWKRPLGGSQALAVHTSMAWDPL